MKPAPPVRSSSQPSVRDQRYNEETNVSYNSRTLPRDTRVNSQRESESQENRTQREDLNRVQPQFEQNGGMLLSD